MGGRIEVGSPNGGGIENGTVATAKKDNTQVIAEGRGIGFESSHVGDALAGLPQDVEGKVLAKARRPAVAGDRQVGEAILYTPDLDPGAFEIGGDPHVTKRALSL